MYTTLRYYISACAIFALAFLFFMYTISLVHAQAPPPPPPPPPPAGGSSSGSSGGYSSSGGGAPASPGGSTSGGASCSVPSVFDPGTQYLQVGTYTSITLSTSGGTPDTFAVVGLPPGMTQTGSLISGTPSVAGTYSVAVAAQNACGTGTGNITVMVTSVAGGSDTGGVGLGSLPETGIGIDYTLGKMLLYAFVVLMAAGAVLVLVMPKVSYARRRRSRFS